MDTETKNLIELVMSAMVTLATVAGFWYKLPSDQAKFRTAIVIMKILALLVAVWAMAIIGQFWQGSGTVSRGEIVSVVLAGYMLTTSFVAFLTGLHLGSKLPRD